MTAPKFDPAITLGNLLNLFGIVAAIGVGWGVHTKSMETIGTEVRQLQEVDRDFRVQLGAKDAQITSLLVSSAEQKSKLESIEKGVEKIGNYIDRQRP